MDSLEQAIEQLAAQLDSPLLNLTSFLSAGQQTGEYRCIADLSNDSLRKQALDDAQKLLCEKLYKSNQEE